MKAVSRRRHDALAELYDRHGKRLRATIDGVVHEGSEADDVLQEIFIQIWEEAGRYSPKAGKPLGWMVTIARRRAIDRLRRRQAYSRVRERYQERVVQQTPNSPREADDVFVLNDLRHFLKQCMRVLPRLQREALELRFFQGAQPQGNCHRYARSAGNGKNSVGTGLAETHPCGKRPLRQKV